jgi:hypothetical protein
MSKNSAKKMPSIRLGSGSGARGALKALKTGHHEDVPNEEEGGDGLPNKKTYMLLKRLYETLDEPFNGEGLSWYDKVHSVKIDNAANLLYKTTWRDFFEHRDGKSTINKTKNRNRSAHSSSPASRKVVEKSGEKKREENSKADTERGRKVEVKESGKKKKKALKPTVGVTDRPEDNLNVAFERMVERVELLWMELKVSESEKEFYKHTLCKRPCAGMSQLNAIAKYIVCLHDYRLATIEVLEAIDARESVLARVEDVTSSYLQRREEEEEHLARLQLRQQQQSSHSTPVRGGIRSLRAHTQSGNRQGPPPGSLVDALGGPDGMGAPDDGPGASAAPFSPHRSQQLYALLREDLVQALHELQVLSVGVVRAVQRWRHGLWRPLPFVWQGVDYLQKMQHDTAFLDHEEGPGALIGDFINTIPLCREDLRGLLHSPSSPPGPGPGPGPGQPSSSAAPCGVVTILGLSALSEEGLKSPLRQWFLQGGPAAEELAAVSAIVQEEATLVGALSRERRRLAQEGVFIPSLRILFESEKEPGPAPAAAAAAAAAMPPVPAPAHASTTGRVDGKEVEPRQQQREDRQSSRAGTGTGTGTDRGRGRDRDRDRETPSSNSRSSPRARVSGGGRDEGESARRQGVGQDHPAPEEEAGLGAGSSGGEDDDDAVMLRPPSEAEATEDEPEEEEDEEESASPVLEARPSPLERESGLNDKEREDEEPNYEDDKFE